MPISPNPQLADKGREPRGLEAPSVSTSSDPHSHGWRDLLPILTRPVLTTTATDGSTLLLVLTQSVQHHDRPETVPFVRPPRSDEPQSGSLAPGCLLVLLRFISNLSLLTKQPVPFHLVTSRKHHGRRPPSILGQSRDSAHGTLRMEPSDSVALRRVLEWYSMAEEIESRSVSRLSYSTRCCPDRSHECRLAHSSSRRPASSVAATWPSPHYTAYGKLLFDR